MIVQAGEYTLDCDVDATVAAFHAYTPNLPWTCDCSGCRNYRAAEDLIFTDPVLSFFAQFGIDPNKPAEIYEGGLIGDVFHCFAWFHFIGRIVHLDHQVIDLAPPRQAYLVMTTGAVNISDVVKVDFHEARDLATKSFQDQPLVQVECKFKIPWLLAEPGR